MGETLNAASGNDGFRLKLVTTLETTIKSNFINGIIPFLSTSYAFIN
jgi:hypothetical protein